MHSLTSRILLNLSPKNENMRSHRILAAFTGVALCGLASANETASRPNIIIIVADDMGYSDPGCYGGELATPALDRLAREGIRLTHCYNGGMCVVSRVVADRATGGHSALPNFAGTPLLSERLQQAGYRTAIIGKWHLQGHPMDRGFDHFFGFLNGFTDHFSGSDSYRLDREPFRDFGRITTVAMPSPIARSSSSGLRQSPMQANRSCCT